MAPPGEVHDPKKLLRPIIFIGLSAWYIPITIYNLLITFQFSKLTSWSAFQKAWFGTFWTYFGPGAREVGVPAVVPLLQNAYGVVLDIGPGSGEWISCFSASENKNGIRKIFGVEPNFEHHNLLRRRIQEAGLEDVYEILGAGAEDLAKCGIDKSSIDTICTIQCLCSVPGPEKIVQDLYPYLKPGGKWLVYEHIKTKYQGEFIAYWQGKLVLSIRLC